MPLVLCEALERRLFLSVSGAILAGPYTVVGTTWNYTLTIPDTGTGPFSRTVVGPTTVDGTSVIEIDSTLSGTDQRYVTQDGSGNYVTVEDDNIYPTGEVDDAYSPPEIIFPASMTAGLPYEFDSTETKTNTIGGGTPVVSTEDQDITFTLDSETPVALTVPYGTVKAYDIHQAETDTRIDDQGNSVVKNSSADLWCAPGIGIVQVNLGNGSFYVLNSFVSKSERLNFTQGPTDTDKGETIDPVQVSVLKADGSVDTDAVGSITLSLNSVAGDGKLTGTVNEALVNGVATFSDLAIDAGGTYTLSAVDDAVPVVTTSVSDSFDIEESALTWTGAGDGVNWSDPKNWDGDVKPVNGDSLIFPGGSPLTSTNDLTDLSLASIDIEGSGYTLTGNAISLTDNLTSEAGNNTYDIDTALVGSPTLKDVAGDLTMESVLSGDGVTFAGSGTLTIEKSNTYTGQTDLASGVTIDDNVASGAFGTGTVVVDSNTAPATIDTSADAADVTLSNKVSLEGDLSLVIPSGKQFLKFSGEVDIIHEVAVYGRTISGGVIGGINYAIFGGPSKATFTGDAPVEVDKTTSAPGIDLQNSATDTIGGDFTGSITVGAGATLDLVTSSSSLAPLQGNGSIDVVSGGTLETDPTAGAAGLPDYTGEVILETGGTIEDYDTVDKVGLGTGTLDILGGLLGDAVSGNAAVTVANPVKVEGDVTVSTSNSIFNFSGEVDIIHEVAVYGRTISGGVIGGINYAIFGGPSKATFTGDAPVEIDKTTGAPGIDLQNSATDTIGGDFTGSITVGAGATLDLVTSSSSLAPLQGNGSIDVVSGGTLETDPTAGAAGLPDYTGEVILETGGTIEDYDTVDQYGLGTGTLDLKGGKLENAGTGTETFGGPVDFGGNVELATSAHAIKFSGEVEVTSFSNVDLNAFGSPNLSPGFIFSLIGGTAPVTFTGTGSVEFDKVEDTGGVTVQNTGNDTISGPLSGGFAVGFGGNLTIMSQLSGNGSIEVQDGGTLSTDPTPDADGMSTFSGTMTEDFGGTIKNFDTVDQYGLGTGTLDLKGGTLEDAAGANIAIGNPINIDGNVTLDSKGNRLKLDQAVDVLGNAVTTLLGTIVVNGSLTGSGDLDLEGNALDVAGSNPDYSGDITLSDGVIEVVQNEALGTGKLTVDTAGQVTLESVSTIGDPILDNPLEVVSGTFILEGQFTFPAGITVDAGAILEIEGAGTSVIDPGPLSGGGKILLDGGTFSATGDQSQFTGTISNLNGKSIPSLTVTDAGGVANGSPFPATVTLTGTSGTPSDSLDGVSPTVLYYVGSKVSGTGTSTPPSAIGTYTAVASFAGSANYIGVTSAPVTFAIISQSPTKTPPTITAPPKATVAENGSFSFAATNLISVADTDANGTAELLTLTAGHGTIGLLSLANLSVISGANGTGTITVSGTIADLTAALNGLTYTPSGHFSGSDALKLSITDQDSQTASKTVAIIVQAAKGTLVEPKVRISVSSHTIVPGQPLTIHLDSLDLKRFSPNKRLRYTVSFGDGTSRTFVGQFKLSLTHVYQTIGNYTISVTATDQAGHTGNSVTQQVSVVSAAVERSPFSRPALFVGGTPQSDVIELTDAGRDRIAVTVNHIPQGTFFTAGPIYIERDGGRDVIMASYDLRKRIVAV